MEPLEINNALLRHLTNPAVCVYRNHSKFLVSWCFLPQMNRKQFNILVFCAIQYPAHQVFVNKCKKDIKQLKQIEVNEHSRVCPSGIGEEFLTSTFRFDFFYPCLLFLQCLIYLLNLQDVQQIWELVMIRVSQPEHPGYKKKLKLMNRKTLTR